MSETLWRYRWHVLVEAGNREAANALWTLIAPCGDAEASTFGIAVSADGVKPTHYACSTAATEEMRAILDELTEEGLPEGLAIIAQGKDDPTTFDDALRGWGMQRVEDSGHV